MSLSYINGLQLPRCLVLYCVGNGYLFPRLRDDCHLCLFIRSAVSLSYFWSVTVEARYLAINNYTTGGSDALVDRDPLQKHPINYGDIRIMWALLVLWGIYLLYVLYSSLGVSGPCSDLVPEASEPRWRKTQTNSSENCRERLKNVILRGYIVFWRSVLVNMAFLPTRGECLGWCMVQRRLYHEYVADSSYCTVGYRNEYPAASKS